jgi:undecaprenyl-diphosphatase
MSSVVIFFMALWHISETQLDRKVAKAVVDHTTPMTEDLCGALTWAADEHLLYGVAAVLWGLSRQADRRRRQQGNHLVASVAVTALLPHLLKRLIDQERPDRCMVPATRRQGIPKSGKPLDAFPSGHAMHIGAIASALSRANPKATSLIWTVGGLIAATRIVLLAHWTTDVLVGLALGAGTERALWSIGARLKSRLPRPR